MISFADALVNNLETSICREFFTRLQAANKSLLMLDYDGTLAPFKVARMKAVPYSGVVDRLNRLSRTGAAVVIISGRPVKEVQKLLAVRMPLEIWGCNGYERVTSDGKYRRYRLGPEVEDALDKVQYLIVGFGLKKRMEVKVGAVLLHWRGQRASVIETLRLFGENLFDIYTIQGKTEVKPFDGGIELRATSRDKGLVVRELSANLDADTPAAYLGDDTTDEDAFAALRDDDLPVLVRREFRPSKAKAWLKPPRDLLKFLDLWEKSIKFNTKG